MSANVFHEIYLHLVWRTKNNMRLLTKPVADRVHHFLKERCDRTGGVYFHSVGGTDDHVHLVVNIEPTVTISELVGELKGFSARQTNKLQGHRSVIWQRGYGVVSFGKGNLEWVEQYVAGQEEHHQGNRVQDRLERIEFDDEECLKA